MRARQKRRSGEQLAGLFLLALVAACGADQGEPGVPPPGEDRPNLLLISLDSVRADHLSCSGYRSLHAPETPTTPRLDRLAAEGIRFSDARSSSSWTLPSHVALLTGLPDLVHAVELDEHSIGAGTPTLSERLAAAGYRTTGFFSGPYLEPRFGFDRGFSRYQACYGSELERASADFAEAHAARRRLGPADLAAWRREAEAARALEIASQSDHSADRVADAVIAELATASAQRAPFFCFAHFFDPHYDYAPSPELARRFDPDYDGSLDASGFIRNPAIAAFDGTSPSGRRRILAERDLEHLLALYDAELAATDAAVGRILDELDRLGLEDSTLVAVVADHGDEFFEHDGIGHRRTLYPEVLHVPLLIRYPPRLSGGRVIDAPVATYDLMPALLELLGVPTPDLGRGSIAPHLLGGAVEKAPLLSRIVLRRPSGVTVEMDGREQHVRVEWVDVLESCRVGSIDVQRSRNWYIPIDTLPPGLEASLREDTARRRSEEVLRWTDLDQTPLEPEDSFQESFEDPRAAAALDIFATAVEHWTEERERRGNRSRGQSGRVSESPGQRIRLGALGYGGGGDAAAPALDTLALPPPTTTAGRDDL